jgi:hypothetical protein
MFAVRYIALVILVVWVGGMILVLAGGAIDDVIRRFNLFSYACGATILVGFFVMKFVGPPPRAFKVRAGLVSLMLLVTRLSPPPRISHTAITVNMALGLVLLSWYARE